MPWTARYQPTPKSKEFEGLAWSANYTRPGARDQAFEAAGRAVIARAGLDIDGRADAGKYRPLDCVFCDTETGGSVFIGNIVVSANVLSPLNGHVWASVT